MFFFSRKNLPATERNKTCPIEKHLAFTTREPEEIYRFVYFYFQFLSFLLSGGNFRFISYMFVHGDYTHLLFNVFIQLFLGLALETVHGWWRVGIVYFSGVAAGSMIYSITTTTPLIGASGGVYSLITAHIATIFMNWHEMESGMLQLFVFLILCSTNFTTELYHYNQNSKVAHNAHFSGALAGLLVGIGVLRNLNVRPYQKKIWFGAVSVYIILMIGGVIWNIKKNLSPS